MIGPDTPPAFDWDADHSAAAFPDDVVNLGREHGGPFTPRQVDALSWIAVDETGRSFTGVPDPWALGGLVEDSYPTEYAAQRCADWLNGALYALRERGVA
jgi:hypothetical protein